MKQKIFILTLSLLMGMSLKSNAKVDLKKELESFPFKSLSIHEHNTS